MNIRKNIVDSMWEKVESSFKILANMIKRKNPNASFNWGRYETEIYPIRFYASFFQFFDPNRDEDLVIILSLFRKDLYYKTCCDISKGDGTILAELPEIRFSYKMEQDYLVEKLNLWLNDCIEFLNENEELIISELFVEDLINDN